MNRSAFIGVLAPAAVFAATMFLVGPDEAAADDAQPPRPNAPFDYQIGGGYPPPSGVEVVSRDRLDVPAPGLYNICYVNAFQTQPDEIEWWQENHDDLLLRDANGDYVVDGEWNEILLDTSTSAKREALTDIVGSWMAGCADDGFDAIEPDNLDSWQRSKGLLSQDDAIDYIAALADVAHLNDLAIAQKNTAELGTAGRAAGLDFAVAEECGRYDECDVYSDAYDDHVVVIEYRRQDFQDACAGWGDRLGIVLRDKNVTVPGSDTYVYDSC